MLRNTIIKIKCHGVLGPFNTYKEKGIPLASFKLRRKFPDRYCFADNIKYFRRLEDWN